MSPFAQLAAMADPRDDSLPADYARVPGSATLVLDDVVPPRGRCPGCGYEQLACCDGDGTALVPGGYVGCPRRAKHVELRRPTWSVVRQEFVYPRGYRRLEREK